MIIFGKESKKMPKIKSLHSKMACLINKIKTRQDTKCPKIKQHIQSLIDVCDQYIIEVAMADHITYLEFYTLVDIIQDNIACLTQKYLNGKIHI